MRYRHSFITLLATICFMNQVHSQELSIYEWENRLLVMVDSTENKVHTAQQLRAFAKMPEELSARKLLLIQVTPDAFKTFDYFIQPVSTTKTKAPWKRLSDQKTEFKVLLIGLDGGIKARFEDVVTAQVIFDRIDSMPMRRSELDKK